jgi:hypothetical protein
MSAVEDILCCVADDLSNLGKVLSDPALKAGCATNERRGLPNAARALRRLSYSGKLLLVVRHPAATCDATRLRDRGGHQADRARGHRAEVKRNDGKCGSLTSRTKGYREHRAGKKNASTTPPGAAKRHASAPAPSTIGIFDPEVSNA